LPVPVVLIDKALLPIAVLLFPVAEELKFVVKPIETFEGTFPPPLLTNKPLIVPFEPDVEIEPVTVNPDPDITSEPVITADPENGNGEPPVPEVVVPSANRYWEPAPGLKNPKVDVIDPVDIIDPVTTKDPVITADPENGNAGPPPPPFNAKEAVVANEAVPKSEPVRDVAVKEPEIFTVFAAKSPFINGVPEPEAIYNLLLSSIAVEGPAANPIAILFEELPEKLHPAC